MIELLKTVQKYLSKKINPLYVVLILFTQTMLMVSIIIGAVMNSNSKDKDYSVMVDKLTHVKDRWVDDNSVPMAQRKIKYVALYSKYINMFSQKYRKYSMNKWVMADYIKIAVDLTLRLNLPKFYFIANGIMESTLNPNLTGPCKEKGMHQQHRTVMPLVYWSLRNMRMVDPELAKALDPHIKSHDDLVGNPIASLKCQALIAWDCKKFFHDNVPWWVSDAHWGGSVRKSLRWCYKKDQSPPMAYVFYSTKDGKTKIDSRNPLKYFVHWQSIHDKLILGRPDIYREVLYEVAKYKKYKYKMMKGEKEFLNSRIWKNKMLARVAKQEVLYEKLVKETIKYKRYHEKTKGFIIGMDKAMEKIYKIELRKKGRYTKAFNSQLSLIQRLVRKAKRVYKKL